MYGTLCGLMEFFLLDIEGHSIVYGRPKIQEDVQQVSPFVVIDKWWTLSTDYPILFIWHLQHQRCFIENVWWNICILKKRLERKIRDET